MTSKGPPNCPKCRDFGDFGCDKPLRILLWIWKTKHISDIANRDAPEDRGQPFQCNLDVGTVYRNWVRSLVPKIEEKSTSTCKPWCSWGRGQPFQCTLDVETVYRNWVRSLKPNTEEEGVCKNRRKGYINAITLDLEVQMIHNDIKKTSKLSKMPRFWRF